MDSPTIQIKKYLHLLYCRRYIFVIVATTTALLIVFGSFFSVKQYEAESTVFIEANVVNRLMKGLTVSPSMDDRIRVLRYHMLSRDIISRVLKKLDKDVMAGTAEAFEYLVRYCRETTVINIKGKDLFFVSFTNSDPEFAKNYINTLVTTYVEENISAKREESFGAGNFLAEQVDFYKKKLDKLESEINNYRRKTGIFSTVTEESIFAEIKDSNLKIKDLQLNINELLAKISAMKEQLMAMESMEASNGSSFDDLMGGSNDEMRIDALMDHLQDMLLVYNDQYPGVIKVKEQIAELEKRQLLAPDEIFVDSDRAYNPLENPIFVDLKMRLNTTQSDLKALQAQESELLEQINRNRQILQNFPQDKKILADMERDRNMNRNVYETLIARVGIAEVSKQMEVADKATTFRILDPAILPTFPVGTKRLMKMILGLFVGLGAGVGAVVLRDKLDDTVKDADAIRALGITVLAEIPLMYNDEESKREKKKDRLVYSYAGICLAFIVVMIGHDLLGMTVLDSLIANAQIDTLVSDLVKRLH
ncbi:MAG: hypothetical protein BA874_08820 [Desulfuromonadales bacterium C00003068]|jgi:polysaccharide chain length determinant protein (PEP-CTERM system associated)|nr:MAG: hypothetical protein BA874_08820 [Desulfuromonadales bacterium C00003068]